MRKRKMRKGLKKQALSLTALFITLFSVSLAYGEEAEVPVKLYLPKSDIPIELLTPEVQTGDNSILLPFAIIALIAIAVALFIFFTGKRKKNKR